MRFDCLIGNFEHVAKTLIQFSFKSTVRKLLVKLPSFCSIADIIIKWVHTKYMNENNNN